MCENDSISMYLKNIYVRIYKFCSEFIETQRLPPACSLQSSVDLHRALYILTKCVPACRVVGGEDYIREK